jgi:hypothetical protein
MHDKTTHNVSVAYRLLVEQLSHVEQECVRQAEEKIMALELAKTQNGRDGVVVLGHSGSNKHKTAVVPTTEELTRYIYDSKSYQEIQKLRSQAMQQSEEKVAIAEQTYSLVDSTVQRLDEDLAMMEKYVLINWKNVLLIRTRTVVSLTIILWCRLLKAMGEFEAAGGGKPNDLAAIQVNPASPDWILAKVISHDPSVGMYTLSDEDTESNKSMYILYWNCLY